MIILNNMNNHQSNTSTLYPNLMLLIKFTLLILLIHIVHTLFKNVISYLYFSYMYNEL
ncbi:hypothetical protein AHAS_Ahas08G0103400 [Arachis hypogaea]